MVPLLLAASWSPSVSIVLLSSYLVANISSSQIQNCVPHVRLPNNAGNMFHDQVPLTRPSLSGSTLFKRCKRSKSFLLTKWQKPFAGIEFQPYVPHTSLTYLFAGDHLPRLCQWYFVNGILSVNFWSTLHTWLTPPNPNCSKLCNFSLHSWSSKIQARDSDK